MCAFVKDQNLLINKILFGEPVLPRGSETVSSSLLLSSIIGHRLSQMLRMRLIEVARDQS